MQTERAYRLFNKSGGSGAIALQQKLHDGHLTEKGGASVQHLLVVKSFTADNQIVAVNAPPLRSACSNGETTFYVSADNKLYVQKSHYATPALVSQVTNVTQCAFMDGFWFLEADGTLVAYDYRSYKQEDILGSASVRFIGSDGEGTLQLITDKKLYQITSAELAEYRQDESGFSPSTLRPPFAIRDIVAFDAEPLGFTYYIKNGDAYTTNANSGQLCGKSQLSYFKKLGVRKVRRYSPGSGSAGYIIDEQGRLHNCSSAQDIRVGMSSLSDITDDGYLSNDGTLHEFGPLGAEANCGVHGQSYLLFAGTVRVAVSRKIQYGKSNLGLILGLALGLPLGLALIAFVVLLVLRKKGYFLKRPVKRVDAPSTRR